MQFFTKQNIIIFIIVFISFTAVSIHLYNLKQLENGVTGPEFVKVDSAVTYNSQNLSQTGYSQSVSDNSQVNTNENTIEVEEEKSQTLKYMPSTNIQNNNAWLNKPKKYTDTDDKDIGDAFATNSQLKKEKEKASKDKSWLDKIPLPFFSSGSKSSAQISTDPVNLPDDELFLLAKMIEAEAGGEPYLGKVAVGSVILNRVKDSRFPNTVKGVIAAPGQFEPMSNGRFNRVQPSETDYKAAKEAMSGSDPSGGAVYFYAPTLTPLRWHETLEHTVTIGNHKFFK